MTLFFMLSGFILSYRYTNFSCIEDTQRYVSARIARLYPVYLFMGVITLWRLKETQFEFIIVDKFGAMGATCFIVIAVFLFVFALQAWFPGLFNIWNFSGSWSLSTEAFFYSLFPTLRRSLSSSGSRLLVVLMVSLLVLMMLITSGLVVSATNHADTSLIFYVLPIFRLPEFMLGICGFIVFVERGLHRRILAISGAIASVLLVAAIYWLDLPGYIDWGFLAAIVFLAIFVFCLQADAPVAVKRAVNYLGRISYCVYLAQFTTIPLVKKFGGSVSTLHPWILVIGSTFVLAVLSYHLVEVRAYSRTRSLALGMARRLGEFLHVR